MKVAQGIQKLTYLVFFLFACITQGDGQTVAQVNALSERLMTGYSKDTLPTNNLTKEFIVYVDVSLLALVDLDEVGEKLSVLMGFLVDWRDESMVWDIELNHNITDMYMDAKNMWKPYLSVLNSHYSSSEIYNDGTMEPIRYKANGVARWLQLTRLDTKCDLNTKYFPFDVHTCRIRLYCNGYKLWFSAYLYDDNETYTSNGAWLISNAAIKSGDSEFTIIYEFTRKPLFMLVNVLLPIIILTLLTPLVFLLPNGTGERIGFSITTLLAISVYMTIIGSYLPQKSMPLISMMLCVFYIVNTGIVIVVIINTKLFGLSSKTRIPGIFTFLVKFARFTCCRKSQMQRRGAIRCKNGTAANKDVTEVNDIGKGINDKCVEGKRDVQQNKVGRKTIITWFDVCDAIDYTVMVTLYLFKGLFLTTLFMIYELH